jgi:hypothetical protein
MQSKASHLSRSRHGIWYFRWRVPANVRARHPDLPKELKRSTKTADTRRARAIAREMYCELLLRYAKGADGKYDILQRDASGRVYSSRQQGAVVQDVASSSDSLTLVVITYATVQQGQRAPGG